MAYTVEQKIKGMIYLYKVESNGIKKKRNLANEEPISTQNGAEIVAKPSKSVPVWFQKDTVTSFYYNFCPTNLD